LTLSWCSRAAALTLDQADAGLAADLSDEVEEVDGEREVTADEGWV